MKESFLILFIFNVFIIQINSLDLEKIRADILENHNYHRERHQVDDLVRSSKLENIAQAYSEHLASIDQMIHSHNGYGENLFYCGGMEPTGASVSKNWYGENKNHNFSGDWKKGTGHFTQMVWKETKEVGFGKYKNKKGQTFVVANYYPAGNVMGFFKYNVFKP